MHGIRWALGLRRRNKNRASIYMMAVKIKIERSGGFAGISSTHEMDADKLPPMLDETVRKLLDENKTSVTKGLKRPRRAADYLDYKITLQDGKNDHVIKCNELEMDSSLKSLISYIQKNSKKG